MVDTEVLKLIQLADTWMAQQTGEHLNDVQKTILQQALAGNKLKDIHVPGYSNNTIQREIAPKLWKRLSQVIGEKVRIKSVRLVLERLHKGEATEVSAAIVGFSSDVDETVPKEVPGGQVPLRSPLYIPRPPIESRAYEEIEKPGSLIRIKGPNQMGKTSLMARVLHHAETLGYRSVSLNFELADSEVFTNLDKFLQWFCATITDDLKLPIQIESRWSKYLGSKKNCTNYFEKYLLPILSTPLVLGMYEVDRIFPHETVADDFFTLLRAWHEKARESRIWQNFRQIIVHGTEVYIPLSRDQSPFNVGLPISLAEFNASQIDELVRRHKLDLPEDCRDRLMAMVGGHPHLMRVALYKLARQEIEFEQLFKEAPTETGIYGDHLRGHLLKLECNPELAEGLKQVVANDEPVQLRAAIAYKLNSMGLVHLQGNKVTIRNELYREYFRDRFLNSELINSVTVLDEKNS